LVADASKWGITMIDYTNSEVEMSSTAMPTTSLLTSREKHLLKKALFTYAKQSYTSDGKLPKDQHDIIYHIAEKLHLR